MHTIHKLPEEVRSLLARISFFIVALAVFIIWSMSIQSQLASTGTQALFQETPVASPKERGTFRPLAGVIESFRSSTAFFSSTNGAIENKDLNSLSHETFRKIGNATEDSLNKITNIFFN